MMERCLASLLKSREYHTDNPEENNVISGYQYICWIEVLQFRCLIRPAKCGEWPQSRAEPGIQRILVLMKMRTSAFRTFFRHFSCNYSLTALIAVVSRDSVSPPQLTGNTPVTDVLQPVKVSLVKTLRNEFQISILKSLDSSFGHFVHLYKPLRLDHRLYGCMAAVMCSNAVIVRNNLHQKAKLVQILYHGFSCFVTIHAGVFTTQLIDGSIIIHDVYFRKVVSLSNLEVVRVMCRCDLYASGTKFFINILIGNNRDLSVCERKLQHFANNVFVTVIIRVYCNCSISKKCFRTCCCNFHEFSFFSNNRVIDVPEKSVLILMLNLCIGNGSLAYRTPVDNTGTFVDVAFFI